MDRRVLYMQCYNDYVLQKLDDKRNTMKQNLATLISSKAKTDIVDVYRTRENQEISSARTQVLKVLWLSQQISLSAPVWCRNTYSALRQVEYYHSCHKHEETKSPYLLTPLTFQGRKAETKESLNRI